MRKDERKGRPIETNDFPVKLEAYGSLDVKLVISKKEIRKKKEEGNGGKAVVRGSEKGRKKVTPLFKEYQKGKE